MSERRYDDTEIAAIFRAAADGPQVPQRQVPRDEGLTLTDLQAIGREVGISSDAVARAAMALEVRGASSQRRWLGLPIGVARTVDLNRRLTDAEWERFVVQLREVFDAQGTMRADGSLRQWSNGNLRVSLEPTDTGHRLRFRTTHGGARASISGGLVALGVTAAVAISSVASGTFANVAPGMLFLGLVGLATVVSGTVRVSRWARLRGRQMEALAAEVALPRIAGAPSGSAVRLDAPR